MTRPAVAGVLFPRSFRRRGLRSEGTHIILKWATSRGQLPEGYAIIARDLRPEGIVFEATIPFAILRRQLAEAGNDYGYNININMQLYADHTANIFFFIAYRLDVRSCNNSGRLGGDSTDSSGTSTSTTPRSSATSAATTQQQHPASSSSTTSYKYCCMYKRIEGSRCVFYW